MKNNSKLLSREEFKQEVFKRNDGFCVFCQKPAVDAHHILDRKLFTDGGYYIDNGAPVCEAHHWACERTDIRVEEVRKNCGIETLRLPEGFSQDKQYDKWGNEYLPSGMIKPGPLINDDGCKKMLKHKWHLIELTNDTNL